jgi:hypothetical protein
MQKASRFTKILAYQSVGFLAIIALSWLDELIALPSLVFHGNPYISDFHESTIEMLLVLGVWLIVGGATKRIMDRMKHLERFMRVCAWCRRIDYKGQWMALEDFMQQGFDTPTTHGICPCCLDKQQKSIREAKEARSASLRKQVTEPQAG